LKHSSGILVHIDMSITQLLQMCRLHIHDVNLLFHHIPKLLYWIEIWCLWRPFECSELMLFKKPVRNLQDHKLDLTESKTQTSMLSLIYTSVFKLLSFNLCFCLLSQYWHSRTGSTGRRQQLAKTALHTAHYGPVSLSCDPAA